MMLMLGRLAGLRLRSGLSMFAVFDGHGGTEVSKFCAKYMPDVIQSVPGFERKDWVRPSPHAPTSRSTPSLAPSGFQL